MATLNLKPEKPPTYHGKRDSLSVNTWLHQVEQYLYLVQVGNQEDIAEGTKVIYGSSLLRDTAATWWYMKVQSNITPQSWDAFKAAIHEEFIPADSNRQARDRMRRLTQKGSVSSYLSLFRNIAITIATMTPDEQLDRFVDGLKPQIKLEVLKANVSNLQEAAKIALSVDNALFGMTYSSFHGQGQQGNSPTPMEIGNIQTGKGRYPRYSAAQTEERKKLIDQNRCFKCKEVGCRPWKHAGESVHEVNNQEIAGPQESEQVPKNE